MLLPWKGPVYMWRKYYQAVEILHGLKDEFLILEEEELIKVANDNKVDEVVSMLGQEGRGNKNSKSGATVISLE